jgi:ADP-heptose:LPS heptosyltransferase
MTEARIAVPPGVGDCYWALSKLQSFRQRQGISRVHLLVQKAGFKRALDWSKMVEFVDESSEVKFKPNHEILTNGYARGFPVSTDHTLWPNAIVDRGEHLSRWLPEYELNLDFEVNVEEPAIAASDLIVVYHSSRSIHEAWFPHLTSAWWDDLIRQLVVSDIGQVAIIGADWDLPFNGVMHWHPDVMDFSGQTSLRQVAGIIKRARVLVGVISGMTILANHFMTPCVALCPDKFPASFPRAWVKSGAPYIVHRTSEIHSAAQVQDSVLSLVRSA